MQTLPGRPEWLRVETAPKVSFPPLDRDETFDAAVLGPYWPSLRRRR